MGEIAIFTSIYGKKGFFSLEDNTLRLANFDLSATSDLHRIFLGRIKRMMPGLSAAFVEYQPGVNGFLKLSQKQYEACHNEMLLPVQVSTEPLKTKEATLSTQFHLHGLYVVLIHKPGGVTYSKKLPVKMRKLVEETLMLTNAAERDVISAAELAEGNCIDGQMAARQVATSAPSEAMPVGAYEQTATIHTCTEADSTKTSSPSKYLRNEDYTYIIRTNVTEDSLPLLLAEMQALTAAADQILARATDRPQHTLLHPGSDFLLECLGKCRFSRLEKIVTDDPREYEAIKAHLPAPYREKVQLYTDTNFPLTALYSLKGKLAEALSRRVYLKSGGYLVIEPTEALTVIDVNSGKNDKKMSREKLLSLTNQEAARAIPYILSSRGLSGIVVVDFINEEKAAWEEPLFALLREGMALDPNRTEVVDMTALGLCEITRQKKEKPLYEQCKELGIYEAIKA